MNENNLLTEDIDVEYDNLVVVESKLEYKIVMTNRSLMETEMILNDLAGTGWRVVAATDHLIYMERRSLNRLNEG